jgi:hypothetical protein
MLATFSAVTLNLFFNGYNKHTGLIPENPAVKRQPRTMRMWLLMRKVKQQQHDE